MAWIDEGSTYTWDVEYKSWAHARTRALELANQYKIFVDVARRENDTFVCMTQNSIGNEPHSVACRCEKCWQ